MILVDRDVSGGVTPDEFLWLIPASSRPEVRKIRNHGEPNPSLDPNTVLR